MNFFENSPLSKIILEEREFLVKRDDLIDPYLAGNKYRKLYKLLQTPSENLQTIISYGGTQSNAMLAIASMCQKKKWQFIYYTKPLSTPLKEQKFGNFYLAKKLGMHHQELEEEAYRDKISELRLCFDASTYVIDQGGADRGALEGLGVLAQEIQDSNSSLKALATPSGTGTTALYLAINLPEYKIYTTPCVGDAHYLRKQMSALEMIPENLIILEHTKKYHFAKLYREFFEIYIKTKEAGVEFDLLYAPAMWLALLEQTDEDIMYIHSGGVSGNESMLRRYSRKNYTNL